MKILKWFVLLVVAVVAIAVVTLIFWGGNVIKEGVNRMGPRVLGVPVTLESARFYPLRGHVSLTGLIIGNPEGFHTESLFDMSHLEVDLNLRSLFTDTIVIERILISRPQITYEVGMRGANLNVLMQNLEAAADPDEEDPALEEVEPARNVVIKELVLADARAQVSATAMRGQVVPVQLSTITLNNLGGEDQSLTEITTEVIKAILSAVTNAVAGAGDLLGDGLKSALSGAGVVTDFAADGVRGARDAIGDGARGVRGLFGGEKEEDEETVDEDDDATEIIDKKLQEGASRITGALGSLRDRDETEK